MENTATFITQLQPNPEAFAAKNNPTLSLMEFIFTDDKPNANKQGIPESAFANIINTGTLMPIKMSEGGISPGHAGTLPLGVISSLEKKPAEDRNLIVGKAALWSKERPEDVQMIKEAYAAGKPLNISWEVLYTETEVDENGITWLIDPTVRAATFVGVPAYDGRTHLISVASKDLKIEENMNELETKLADAETKKTEAETKLAKAESDVTKLTSDLATANAELTSLRDFKAKTEQAQAEAALLSSRLAKFAEAGLTYKPEEVDAKKAMWLKMDEEAFNYMVSEMKALASVKGAEASKTEPPIPASVTNTTPKNTIEIVREGLKSLKENK